MANVVPKYFTLCYYFPSLALPYKIVILPLLQAYLERPVTILIPTNKAMSEYRGGLNEDLALNHLVNSALMSDALPSSPPRLDSLVTGSPPVWITRRSGWLYFNQARAVERDIVLQSDGHDTQVAYVIDSVLEPLVTISIRDSSFSQRVTAEKLLEKSTLYNLGEGGRARIFYERALHNNNAFMFGVTRGGPHTFFFPVDSAFDEGQACNQDQFLRTDAARSCEVKLRVEKDLIDAKVVEGHIVPGALLLTTLIPTQEHGTVAWEKQGMQVNVSLQPSGAAGGGVMVRSNTVVGNRVHAPGMVVARIVKGNIPVQNGVVHLIDKPLMVVARSLYDYIMEEGDQPGNRLSRYAKLIRDKGGKFGEALLESKDGTLLAPSNEAFDKVDQERLDYILGESLLRQEFLGLHFVRERIASNDPRILADGEAKYSAPASWAFNRVWFHYSPASQGLTVEGRGVNATALEKDIGTVNGVIHVVDTLLGVPSLTIAEKLRQDPLMSHTYSLLVSNGLLRPLEQDRPGKKITFIVPTNGAWEKVKTRFNTAFKTLLDQSQPQYVRGIVQRHMKMSLRPMTIEQLTERSLRNPRRTVDMENGQLMFSKQGEFEFNAYKEWFVKWREVQGRVVRPNIECTNGYIHLVDTAMLDDSPPWTVASGAGGAGAGLLLLHLAAARLIRFVIGDV